MAEKKDYTEQEIQDICNASMQCAIKCAEEGQRPCDSCKLLGQCKAAKEALDDLWKEKG